MGGLGADTLLCRCRLALLGLALLTPVAAPADVASPPPSRSREDSTPGGIPYAVRVDEIRRRIQEALVYPPLARRRAVEGESEVAFEIRAGGHPEGIALVRSSGSTLLDAAAERAVRDAAPLPPVLGRLSIPIRFQLDAVDVTAGKDERP